MEKKREKSCEHRFLFNHIGIEQGRFASALVDVTDSAQSTVDLVTTAGWTFVRHLPLGSPEPGFRGRSLARVDLSSATEGRYVLRFGEEQSEPFRIGPRLLLESTTGFVLEYFRSQRAAAPWDTRDRDLPFVGSRTDRVDVRGGWYDASADLSKYLSHLSYANFMNPQQTPIVVWGLLEHLERLQSAHSKGREAQLLDEAQHGADFLCRMQDPAGYFYMTVFDQWSKHPERRVIAAFETQKGELSESYQAGFRQGGGAAIAALARASQKLDEPRYLDAAERGFTHLTEHNTRYLDDGQENVIDDYCALLAATELFIATTQTGYLDSAHERAERLVGRIREDGPVPGWLVADAGARPFFHAVEAGLPALALLRLAEVDPGRAPEWIIAARRMLEFELQITREIPNPFGYARQFTQDTEGRRRTSFFIPHKNETGYWWQGENARLASLAAAAGRLASFLPNGEERATLLSYALDQLDWICGKNPFDSCMLHGFGRNNQNYMAAWPNVAGGILNGITSSFLDETDVSFGGDGLGLDQTWRWFEQWIPHAAWYLIALAELHSPLRNAASAASSTLHVSRSPQGHQS